MKVRKIENHKNIIAAILIVIMLTLIITSGLCYLMYFAKNSTPNTNNKIKSATDNSSIINSNGKAAKERIINNDNSSSLSIKITQAELVDGIIQINTQLNVLSSKGLCTLEISKGSVSKSYTVKTIASANTSNCMGFSIPVSDLGSKGEWNINIKVSIGTDLAEASQKLLLD